MSHPTYFQMIQKALLEFNKDKRRQRPVSYWTFLKFIEKNYSVGDGFRTYLKRALAKGVEENMLVKVKQSYILSQKAKRQMKHEDKRKKDKASKVEKARKMTSKPSALPSTIKPSSKISEESTKSSKRKRTPISTKPTKKAFKSDDFPTRELQSTGPDSGITEIVFSFDTTGSMSGAIEQVKTRITDTVKRLSEIPNIRIGLISHGDYCDGPSGYLASLDITNDYEKVVDWVKKSSRTAGGDGEENYEYVLWFAANKMSWSPGSKRCLVMIGDNIAHSPQECERQMKQYKIPEPRQINWKEEADECWKNGVRIYAVQAFSHGWCQDFYKSLAGRTCGTYLQLDEFSIVTDALLAICYREVTPERLESLEKEVTSNNRMTKNLKRMFRQLSSELPNASRGRVKKPTRKNSAKSVPTESETSGKELTINASSLPKKTKFDHFWQYYHNGWKNYDLEASEVVEEIYQNYLTNRGDTDVRAVHSGEWEYMVDFLAMKQTNIQHEAHTIRDIRRVKVVSF